MEGGYLASYVPGLVREHLARDAGCASRLLGLEMAAVLLTDMVGFTGRVELATAGGRTALDRFDAEIDRYFSHLIDAAHAEGGDILTFAGDSMLCVWPARDRDALVVATECATRAAHHIQQALGGGEPTRIGIGAGDLRCALAGGHGGRWELLAAGPALSAAIEAERLGRPGEVTLHHEARALLSFTLRTRRLASGAHRLLELPAVVSAPAPDAAIEPTPSRPPAVVAPAALAALEPLVPAVVLHRARAGQSAWLAEVRPVTVVVVGLHGVDWLKPGMLDAVHHSVHRFQVLLEQFGGSPRLSLDDKGLVVAGDFGLPPTAPERHAERAVRAAEQMLAALRELGVDGGIGVATARALCTGFGNTRRRAFGVFGDGTNVATRLMQAAHGQILCDEHTALAARERLLFSAPQDLQVKGRQQVVRVSRPLGRRPAGEAPGTALVGRSEERRRIQAGVEALVAGRGGLLQIEGEAGLGKSMLLAEARRQARDHALRCVGGSGDVVDLSTPYLAWRAIFSDLLEIPPHLDGAHAAQHILSRFAAARNIADRLPLLGPVLGLSMTDTVHTRDLRGDVRAANTHRVMRAVLRHFAADRGLLIALEDAHWLDSASLAYLGWLARKPERWLIVLTSRPLPERRWPPALRGAAVERLSLGEMSDAEVRALAKRVLGVTDLPRALDQLLAQKVGGNPYFCCELLRALQESGRIHVHNGVCQAVGLLGDDLPPTVESAVLGRLDRLAPPEQFCLKTAAVLGQSFREDTLRNIHPQPDERPRVAHHLATALAGDLVTLDVAEPEAAWSFRHAIVRDVTYALWTRNQRSPLHRAVAQWYENRFADDLPPLHPLLAHHWDEAGEAGIALGYLELAGAQALRNGAFDEARRLHARALALQAESGLQADDERRARWHSGLGMALYFLGELALSRQHLEITVGLLDRPLPVGLGATRRRLLSELSRQALHRWRPARFAGRLAHRQEQIEQLAECCSRLGQIYYLDGEPAERLLAVTLAGLNLAEQGAPSAALARVLAGSAILASLAGMAGMASAYAERAQAVAETDAGREAAPQVWHYQAILQAQRGRWDRAGQANDRALALIRERGDQTLEAEACVVRATLLLCQDDFAGAEAAWSRALRLARRVGNSQIECWSLLDQSETLFGRLDLDGAEHALTLALQIPTQPHDGYSSIEKQRMLARLRHARGRLDEALDACEVVYAMVHAQPPAGYHWADFYATTVEVVLDLLEYETDFARAHHRRLRSRARTGCRRLQRMARRFGNVEIRAQTLRARLDWIEGRHRPAEQLWRAAAAQALEQKRAGEAARALAELRRHGLAVDTATVQALLPVLRAQQAEALLDALGANERGSNHTGPHASRT